MARIDINALLRASPVNCRYGAPMGRHARIGPTSGLLCQRTRLVDGAYTADGTYWGGPANLYAVFSPDLETLAFFRADSRAHAIAACRDAYRGHHDLFFVQDCARPGDA